MMTAAAARLALFASAAWLSCGAPPEPHDGGEPAATCDAGLPAWAAALTAGQWYELPGTALSSVEPSPVPAGNTGAVAKVIGWASYAVDERRSRLYVAGVGGFTDYAGNEVDLLELELEAPAWVERVPPTPDAQLGPGGTPYYLDGRPASRETFYGVTFDATHDRVMLFGGIPWYSAGNHTAAVSSFDVAGNVWNPQGTHPDVPGNPENAAITSDPSNGDVYRFKDGDVHRWSASANTWSTVTTGHSFCGGDTMSAFDTQRRRILLVRTPGAAACDDHHTFTLQSGEVDENVVFTGPEAGVVEGSQDALIYVPPLDRFLLRRSVAGSDVYAIHPATFEVTRLPTLGGTTIPATDNGPFKRFLYVPRLGGAVYVAAYDRNTWFLKLHDACFTDAGTTVQPQPLHVEVRCGCSGSAEVGGALLALLRLARARQNRSSRPAARRSASFGLT